MVIVLSSTQNCVSWGPAQCMKLKFGWRGHIGALRKEGKMDELTRRAAEAEARVADLESRLTALAALSPTQPADAAPVRRHIFDTTASSRLLGLSPWGQ
jgi:hypothetical protein